MNKVKKILFRMNLTGNGIVNFDNNDQKWYLKDTDLLGDFKDIGNKNVKYAKKRFYMENGVKKYDVVISSDCLRHNIFKKDAINQSAKVQNDKNILYLFMASIAGVLRGYLFAEKGEKATFKKSSTICIVDAKNISKSISHVEIHSTSGEKSDNSLYYEECIGDTEYTTHGSINLAELQFVSCSQVFDRYAFCPDDFEDFYKKYLKLRLPNFNSELGYYLLSTSSVDISERGFLFSPENIVFLVKEAFTRLIELNISKKSSEAILSNLEYKLVYDVVKDTAENEIGWQKLTTRADIEDIHFEPEIIYVKVDAEKAKKDIDTISTIMDAKKDAKKEKQIAIVKERKEKADKRKELKLQKEKDKEEEL